MRVFTSSYTSARGWTASLTQATDLDGPNTAIFVFAAEELVDATEPFDALHRTFPRSRFVGCSAAGEIHGRAVEDASMVVVVAQFERTRLALTYRPVVDGNAFEAAEIVARDLRADDLAAVFVLATGHDVRPGFGYLTEGMQHVLCDTPVSGGLAAGRPNYRTWVLDDGGAPNTKSAIVALGLYGSALRVGYGSKGGWDKLGPERRITRAQGNVVFELDGRPALQTYNRYLGDLAREPLSGLRYPFALRPDRRNSAQLLRSILSSSEADDSITFANDMPEGSLAQLMRANFDRLVLAAGGAAAEACETTAEPRVCIAVSCLARRVVLGERTEDETEAVVDALPPGCAVAGFYSRGEISPRGIGSCSLHNLTMTLTTFAEEA